MSKKNIFSSLRLRQVLNDLKRRPEDAARSLKLNKNLFNQYLNGKKDIDENFVKKFIEKFPVTINEFLNPNYHTKTNFKIMRASESKKTSRVMQRGGKNYYEYRDTVMDRHAPFRPEWIRILNYVDSNNPNSKSLKWNRGHLLHQLTYFIGKINFYYVDKNKKKKTAVLNTGDSMYIAPYVPHTFSSRDKKCEGYIVAITFSDKISTDVQNYVARLGQEKIKKTIFNEKFKEQVKVTVKKSSKFKNKTLNKNNFKVYNLASNNIVPDTNFFQVEVKKNNSEINTSYSHQYIYILSERTNMVINKKNFNLKRGDTVYLQPMTSFKLNKKSFKAVITQVQSILNQETREQIFHLGANNLNRLVSDNSQWFKK